MTLAIDSPVPAFELPSTSGDLFRLTSAQGKHIVLYFYPKDDTPGCTLEGQGFTQHAADFAKANTVVLGISRDDIVSHNKFKAKYGFSFELLADVDEKVCQLFDVIKEKNMYGRKVMGIERSTFLIDRQGVLRKEWRKVKVDGHVEEVLEAARALG
ncbi:MAG: peroxiredoxin [Gammaproteobacteria bacterium]|nr:peroxiredoxin [Gammaproteobacteria bacterium]